MAEHYPRGTERCHEWCNVCNRFAYHRVDFPPAGQKGGGRKGPCLEHKAPELTKKQITERAKRAAKLQQKDLFE